MNNDLNLLAEEHHLQQLFDCRFCSFSASLLPCPLPVVPVPSFFGSFLAGNKLNDLILSSIIFREINYCKETFNFKQCCSLNLSGFKCSRNFVQKHKRKTTFI